MLPPGYRGHVEVLAALRALGGFDIGSSVEHTPIVTAAFGPADAPRTSIVIGGLHAMEWIGVETALAIAHRLADAPPTDRRVFVVALANPDGYRQVETDLWAGRKKFRRLNRNDVDLNRNWPTAFVPRRKWVAWINWGGPRPASEPETAAILRLLDRELARGAAIDTALSLHSFGRKLLYPYGHRLGRSARHAELYERARRVRDRLVEPYSISQVSRWLPGFMVGGMEIDHLHDRYGACALLVECAFGGGLTLDLDRWTSPFRWYNPRRPGVVAGDLARALEPFVRGG